MNPMFFIFLCVLVILGPVMLKASADTTEEYKALVRFMVAIIIGVVIIAIVSTIPWFTLFGAA